MISWQNFLKEREMYLRKILPNTPARERLKIISDEWAKRQVPKSIPQVLYSQEEYSILNSIKSSLTDGTADCEKIFNSIRKCKREIFHKFICDLDETLFQILIQTIIQWNNWSKIRPLLILIDCFRPISNVMVEILIDNNRVQMSVFKAVCYYCTILTSFFEPLLRYFLMTSDKDNYSEDDCSVSHFDINVSDRSRCLRFRELDNTDPPIGFVIGQLIGKISPDLLRLLIRSMTSDTLYRRNMDIEFANNFAYLFLNWASDFKVLSPLLRKDTVLHHLILKHRIIPYQTFYTAMCAVPEGIFLLETLEQPSLDFTNRPTMNVFLDMFEKMFRGRIPYSKDMFRYTYLWYLLDLETAFPNENEDRITITMVRGSIEQRINIYNASLKEKLKNPVDALLKRKNDVYLSTQEEISPKDTFLCSSDYYIFHITELKNILEYGKNPYTNLDLEERDKQRIQTILEQIDDRFEPFTESNAYYLNKETLYSRMRDHLDSMMKKSIFLYYSPKFSSVVDSIFRSELVLNSVHMYLYEPGKLYPYNKSSDYRDYLTPLTIIQSLEDLVVLKKYWGEAFDTTRTTHHRKIFFTGALIYIMNTYGTGTVNLFAYVAENFVCRLPL